jgi:hypothetical protein
MAGFCVSKYLFFEKKPDIPTSHTYRNIDVEEFCRLIDRVSSPCNGTTIMIKEDWAAEYVVNSLTERFAQLQFPGSFEVPVVCADEVAVVLESAKIGFFMGWPSIRGVAQLVDACKFGVLEPLPK